MYKSRFFFNKTGTDAVSIDVDKFGYCSVDFADSRYCVSFTLDCQSKKQKRDALKKIDKLIKELESLRVVLDNHSPTESDAPW